MKKIGLISDTHGYLDPSLYKHFALCDEVWHAGDIGAEPILEDLTKFNNFRAVHGNIDDRKITGLYPKDLRFELEGVDVFITHIGGYPGRYTARVKELMQSNAPRLYICGHSHILKVVFDEKYNCLHMNPGACGHHGFHHVRTALRFVLDEGVIKNAEVIELGLRGRTSGMK